MCVRVCACACVRVWSAGAPHTGRVKSRYGLCPRAQHESVWPSASPSAPPSAPERLAMGPAPRPEGEAALGWSCGHSEACRRSFQKQQVIVQVGQLQRRSRLQNAQASQETKTARQAGVLCAVMETHCFLPACSLGCCHSKLHVNSEFLALYLTTHEQLNQLLLFFQVESWENSKSYFLSGLIKHCMVFPCSDNCWHPKATAAGEAGEGLRLRDCGPPPLLARPWATAAPLLCEPAGGTDQDSGVRNCPLPPRLLLTH